METCDPVSDDDNTISMEITNQTYESLNRQNTTDHAAKDNNNCQPEKCFPDVKINKRKKRRLIGGCISSVIVGFAIYCIVRLELRGTSDADWKWYNGHRYLFARTKFTWFQAMRSCIQIGGYLVKIENANENNWLKTQISDTWTWLGANDITREGRWEWVSDGSLLTYTDWNPGEPNNINKDGVENCAHFNTKDHNQRWMDNHCTRLLEYVCEKD